MASTPDAGLCATCRHARAVESGRGSRFVLCQRSRNDPRFARYPRLPVGSCDGYEPAASPTPPMRRASGGRTP